MTTDITELAQSLKAEGISPERMEWLKKLADMKYCASNPGHWLMSLKETNYLAVVALKCIENNLALVEALEKAQQVDEELCKLLPPGAEYMDPPDGGDVTPLEGVRRMVADYRQRIAELESRTVKLPKPHAHLIWIQAGHAPDDYWDDVAVSHSEKDRCCDGSERYPVYARWEIEEMLAAAGIKVEAE
ncbi:hypothetical protein [Klebsiella quasipneumoniae]|uniref:hypothetical protein n=1 Tax=Klebsiella quasipneumoniae TaxID=1463165 RepID=UPI003CFB34B2